MYRNNGGGTFADVSREPGIGLQSGKTSFVRRAKKGTIDQPIALLAFSGFKAAPGELGPAWAEVGHLKKAISVLAPIANLDLEAKSRLADLYSRTGDTSRALALY